MDDQRTRIENESGIFEADQNGRLISFHPSGQNVCESPDPQYRKAVLSLRIPEGIRFIGSKAFQPEAERFNGFFIRNELTFPQTLLSVGDYNFCECAIGRVVLPPSLKKIGCGSFSCSRIRDLVVQKEILEYCDQEIEANVLQESPANKLIFGGRSFKACTVEKVTAVGRQLFCFTPGVRRLNVLPEMTRMTTSEWIDRLMPEAKILYKDRRM